MEPLDEMMIDMIHWSHWTRRSTGATAWRRDDYQQEPLETIDRSHWRRRLTAQEPLETIDSTGATGDNRQEPLLVVERGAPTGDDNDRQEPLERTINRSHWSH